MVVTSTKPCVPGLSFHYRARDTIDWEQVNRHSLSSFQQSRRKAIPPDHICASVFLYSCGSRIHESLRVPLNQHKFLIESLKLVRLAVPYVSVDMSKISMEELYYRSEYAQCNVYP